jgi:hypothetical protein
MPSGPRHEIASNFGGNNGFVQEQSAEKSSRSPRRVRSPATTAPRIIATTGLIVSAFLTLVSYLDRSRDKLVVFGCLTVISLLALLKMRAGSRR